MLRNAYTPFCHKVNEQYLKGIRWYKVCLHDRRIECGTNRIILAV